MQGGAAGGCHGAGVGIRALNQAAEHANNVVGKHVLNHELAREDDGRREAASAEGKCCSVFKKSAAISSFDTSSSFSAVPAIFTYLRWTYFWRTNAAFSLLGSCACVRVCVVVVMGWGGMCR